ncbi:MAG: hypothetical protein WC423_11795 [Vulcanimicrobiota bacterium]
MATLYINDTTPLEDMSLEEMQAAFTHESDWLGRVGKTVSETVSQTLENLKAKFGK